MKMEKEGLGYRANDGILSDAPKSRAVGEDSEGPSHEKAEAGKREGYSKAKGGASCSCTGTSQRIQQ
jgi:hypothetical protein